MGSVLLDICLFGCAAAILVLPVRYALRYLLRKKDTDRTNNMAIAIAFAAGAVDGKLCDEEISAIKKWAQKNMPNSNNRKFHRSITKTAEFFLTGNNIDIEGMCQELVLTAKSAARYDAIQLAMETIAADGIATVSEMEFIKKLALRLEIDSNKFRSMLEAIVPVNIHQNKDLNLLFGIDEETNDNNLTAKLNTEYRKWNSRITNSDEKISEQAHLMIELITQAKKKLMTNQISVEQ